mmetsp:Transcript_9248/g.22287  ORF Transcript_9248/g.22287 Transcript_9248/m.22287 type:complete len:217 (+) Transcript_9248:2094-2744(+)
MPPSGGLAAESARAEACPSLKLPMGPGPNSPRSPVLGQKPCLAPAAAPPLVGGLRVGSASDGPGRAPAGGGAGSAAQLPLTASASLSADATSTAELSRQEPGSARLFTALLSDETGRRAPMEMFRIRRGRPAIGSWAICPPAPSFRAAPAPPDPTTLTPSTSQAPLLPPLGSNTTPLSSSSDLAWPLGMIAASSASAREVWFENSTTTGVSPLALK